MATIGRFTQSKDGGWTETIRTLTINAKVRLVPNDDGENPSAPAYRLLVGHHYIGDARQPQTNDSSSQPYLRVRLDDPVLPGPINATLFTREDGLTARLIWNRTSCDVVASRFRNPSKIPKKMWYDTMRFWYGKTQLMTIGQCKKLNAGSVILQTLDKLVRMGRVMIVTRIHFQWSYFYIDFQTCRIAR